MSNKSGYKNNFIYLKDGKIFNSLIQPRSVRYPLGKLYYYACPLCQSVFPFCLPVCLPFLKFTWTLAAAGTPLITYCIRTSHCVNRLPVNEPVFLGSYRTNSSGAN